MLEFKDIEKFVASISVVGNGSAETSLTSVLPDNSILFGFQTGKPVYEKCDGEHLAMKGAGVCGQLTRKKEYLNLPGSETVLVRFKPWAAGLFFDDLPALADANTNLRDLISREQFERATADFHEKSDKLQAVKAFLSRQFSPKRVDSVVVQAIERINQSQGQIRVEQLAYELFNSRRNFERKFKAAVGLSPKKFIDNVRLQSAVRLLRSNSDLQEVAFSAGYYDMPHFIHNFKYVMGTTPEKFRA